MKKDLFLVIDMQNVYLDGQWKCDHTKDIVPNIKKILELDMDSVFTKFIASQDPVGTWKDYNTVNAEVNEDVYANEMIEDFKDYPVYTKSTYSSLTIPEVLEKAKKCNRVVVAGVVAECCVLSTVLALIDEGVPVIYLTDAVAGINSETEKATELILSGLEPVQVKRMTTEEYIQEGESYA